MGKILCSREPWDSILGHNRPNGSSRTWNFAETKTEPSLLHTITGDIVDSYIRDSTLYNPNHYSLSFHDDFEDVEIHEIKDKKHLYIIRVFNHDFFRFNLDIGFSCISELVLADARIGKCGIIIEATTEGKYTNSPNTELDIIERWRIKANLPEYSVTVFHGNLICDEHVKRNDLKINAYGVSAFETFFSIPEDYQNDKTKIVPFDAEADNPKKYFLSYNRQPRSHRLLFAYYLWQAGLTKKGLFSLKFDINMGRLSDIYTKKVVDDRLFKKMVSEGDYTIDISTVDNLANNFSYSNYEDTFVSVVTETLQDNGCIFFSEKIWKPISIGHPFILMGNPFSLRKLKDLGFQTFSDFWDESYDNIISESERILAITKLVKKITLMSNQELADIREKAKPILIHNRQVFNERIEQNYKGRPELKGVILPIADLAKQVYNNLGYNPLI